MSIVAIIALYNGARWIEQSIASVLMQTLPPDEFIVVDDGSTDDGPALVQRMAKEHPITLLRKSNGGQSSARNFGVSHSKSDLIALLDQDDAWYPHHLEKLIEPFRQKRHIPLGWVYSDLDMIDERGNLLTRNYLRDPPVEHPKRHLYRCLGEDMHILPSASLISRDAFESVGGFDERLSGYEDDDLFLKIFTANYDNVFLDEPLSKWRMNGSSASHTAAMIKSSVIYARKLMEQYPEHAGEIIAPRFNHALSSRYSQSFHDPKRRREAIEGLEYIAPYLRRKARMRLLLSLPIRRSQLAWKIVIAARSIFT
jgi:glycosyltransferase involved in cell wall biosynthesis